VTAPALAYVPATIATAVVHAAVAHRSTRLDYVLDLIERSNAPNLVGRQRWAELLARHRPDIERASSNVDFAEALNALLSECDVSHFAYYTTADWSYWFLRSTFESPGPATEVAHIGVYPQKIDASWFVRGIFEGSVAAEADIKVGDELLSVDGQPYRPIRSFEGKADVPVTIKLRRKPELTHEVVLTPLRESLYDVMIYATLSSITTLRHGEYRYAYLHGWSLLGDSREYWQLLSMQDEVDGLLLDYRDGVGGHVGHGHGFLFGPIKDHQHWTKPTVILIADGTRSAKEILVNEARKRNRAPLVGTPTPGHVTTVAGTHQIGADGLLMLPGETTYLEGRPTRPDYMVERQIKYCAGADPQLDRAKEILAVLIKASHEVPAPVSIGE
jgi:carboxyl-terminal processing protease